MYYIRCILFNVILSLWRDKHPAIKGLRPPEHHAGQFHADHKKTPPSKKEKHTAKVLLPLRPTPATPCSRDERSQPRILSVQPERQSSQAALRAGTVRGRGPAPLRSDSPVSECCYFVYTIDDFECC